MLIRSSLFAKQQRASLNNEEHFLLTSKSFNEILLSLTIIIKVMTSLQRHLLSKAFYCGLKSFRVSIVLSSKTFRGPSHCVMSPRRTPAASATFRSQVFDDGPHFPMEGLRRQPLPQSSNRTQVHWNRHSQWQHQLAATSQPPRL
jgi:hypothetical protein